MSATQQTETSSSTVSIREAAGLLGVHTNTVRRRVKNGQLRAEKIRTERGDEYRIPLVELDSDSEDVQVEFRPAAVAPITGRGHRNHESGRRSYSADHLPDSEGSGEAELSAATLYADLKASLSEAASLRAERNIVESQLADARNEIAALRERVEGAESKLHTLETERIELLAELEQLRIALRHREDRKRWRL